MDPLTTSTPVVSTTPTLKRGDTGEAVKSLQAKLHVHVDGIFGQITESKVKALQGAHGLPKTGVVDLATLKALDS